MEEGRAFQRQSLGFLSRKKVSFFQWIRPRISRHAFLEVVPAGDELRVFGVHLSAVHAAWTERRRVLELRELLKSVDRHREGFHVLTGDFNTVAPGEEFDTDKLPFRLKPLIWLSGGSVRWRTIQTVLDAGYVDSFKLKHPDDPGLTLPTTDPHIRLDYVFVPHRSLHPRDGMRGGAASVCREGLRSFPGGGRSPRRRLINDSEITNNKDK